MYVTLMFRSILSSYHSIVNCETVKYLLANNFKHLATVISVGTWYKCDELAIRPVLRQFKVGTSK